MKTNLFKVRKKTEDRILIEEEKYKNPFLLFFKFMFNTSQCWNSFLGI